MDQDNQKQPAISNLQAAIAKALQIPVRAPLTVQPSPEKSASGPWQHEPPHILEAEILLWLAQQPPNQPFSSHYGWIIARCPLHPDHSALQAALHYLSNRFGSQLGTLAAELYFSPYHWLQRQYANPAACLAIFAISSAALAANPPAHILTLIEGRITKVLAYLHLNQPAPLSDEMHFMAMLPTGTLQTWAGSIQAAIHLLLCLPPTLAAEVLVERLRGLSYISPSSYGGLSYFSLYQVINLSILQALAALHSYDQLDEMVLWQATLLIPEALLHFSTLANHQHDLTLNWYKRLPGPLQPLILDLIYQQRESSASGRASLQERIQELLPLILDRLARPLTPARAYVIAQLRHKPPTPFPLVGSRWLLLAAETHARLQLGPLTIGDSQDSLNTALILLAQVQAIEPETNAQRQPLVAQLQTYPPTTLKRLLPVSSSGGRSVLCEALGWQAVEPLLIYIGQQVLPARPGQEPDAETEDKVALIDVAELLTLLAQTPPTIAREALTLYREANAEQILIEAAAGWNRPRIEKSLKHNALAAITAYGLLPIRDEAELCLRYQTLQKIYKQHTKFGPQRRVSHRLAVQAALSYLAELGGYADVTLLELAMEAKIATDVAPNGRSWSCGTYLLQLHLDGLEVELHISRNGNALKSVPAAIRQQAPYKEARQVVDLLREQMSRLRLQFFEKLISSGQPLSLEHLRLIASVPIARALLERLILQIETNTFGLFAPSTFALRSLDGSLHPITTAVRIAHPSDLYQAGTLGAWQREIVSQRLVQPIKQAFRELYLLTPAEQQARTSSQRFAERTLNSRIAARLFGTRQWRFMHDSSYSSVVPYKTFLSLRAIFELRDAYRYLGATDTVTTSSIYFERLPIVASAGRPPLDRYLPLEEVPPLIFSEVMRDADLLVSVAQVQHGGEVLLSNEAYEKRGELVKTLLMDLGLEGVEIVGHFAFIQGQLARYRVHLGSASIHIEPGHYLCIVPANWGTRHEQLFLPFIDEKDSKISEIISKIFLLLADTHITDESILRQIHAHP